nr:hypothetical protein [Ardenticatena sp.]
MTRERISAWLVVSGSLAGGLGWWLPWVAHPKGAAALVLLGLDLGDFFKFTTLWRNGGLQWERHFFFLPPALATLGLLLWATRLGWRGRTVMLGIAIPMALVLLPEYERWHEWQSPEFRFQSTLAIIVVITALLVWAGGPRLPRSLTTAAGAVVALAGATLPLWAFWRVELLLRDFYGGAIVWGAGIWYTTIGFGIALAGWVLPSIKRQRSRHERTTATPTRHR